MPVKKQTTDTTPREISGKETHRELETQEPPHVAVELSHHVSGNSEVPGASIAVVSQAFERGSASPCAELPDPFAGLSPELRAFVELNRGLTTKQAAAFLGVRPHTLENARVGGHGPAYYKEGRSVRYALQDLMKHRSNRKRVSTSDTGGATA